MKLYYLPGACSIAPHIVAREAGIPLELEKVDLGSKRTASGENYLELNPKGYVPALRLDDGAVLTEVSCLIQYLADLAPAAGLIPPAGTIERYRVLEWVGYLATEVHKGFGPLWNAKLAPEARAAAVSALSHRLDLYSVPQLHFAYDDSIEAGMKLSQLIDDAVAADKKLSG